MASEALEPKLTLPPIWAAALEEPAPAAELAAPVAAEEADEAAAGVEPAALLALVVAPPEDVPVQAERIGKAAALAAPAPRIRNMFLRFTEFPRKIESKPESVTIDLQIIVDRLSTLK